MKMKFFSMPILIFCLYNFEIIFGAKFNNADTEPNEELVGESVGTENEDNKKDSTGSKKWPIEDLKLGQVAGVDVDSEGNVHVFHRGSRMWDGSSFDENNRFQLVKDGAIKEHTHLILDKKTGRILEKYGADRFYMPHGLTIDVSDNAWMTDVALHQVFKFESGKDEPTLVIGEKFAPGSDKNHFCKPTGVAVAKSGEFFVADGYCNSRIVKFSPAGKYMMEFGKSSDGGYPPAPGTFNIPHSVTLVEDWNLVCVADRENERIQCFSAGLRHDPRALPAGTFIKKAEGLGRVYAVDTLNHYLVGVTNSGLTNSRRQLFVVDLESGESRVSEPGLENPHDLAATEDGTIYVAEIGPNRIVRVHL